MRLRVHDDGSVGLPAPTGDVAIARPDGTHTDAPAEVLDGPGWREAVVLDPDADAQRLAAATVPELYRHSAWTATSACSPSGRTTRVPQGSNETTRRAAAMASDRCRAPMRGFYGAETSCARPLGHAGKHWQVLGQEDHMHDPEARPDAATLREQIWDAVDDVLIARKSPPGPGKITDAVMTVLTEYGLVGREEQG